MGGAQPLAVTMNGGVCLIVDVDRGPAASAGSRTATSTSSPTRWTRRSRRPCAAKRDRRALSRRRGRQRRHGLPRAAAPRRRRSTSSPTRPAPTTRCRYVPERRRPRPTRADYAADEAGGVHRPGPGQSMARHVEAMVGFLDAGAEVFDYGNSIRGEAQLGGYERAFAFPGFVPAYIRPLFCEGKGPFRWAALSGDPADIAATDRAVLDLFPENESLARWIRLAGERVAFQGLPARICWLGYGERDRAGRAVQRDGGRGELSGADRDRPRPPRLRLGRLAVPGDRGDARRLRRDRRLAAAQRAGQHRERRLAGCRSTTAAASASAARSTPGRSASPTARRWPAQKIERVLTNDPGMGVIRHVDAGYEPRGRGRRRARRARPDAGDVSDARPFARAVGRARADRPRPGQRRLPAVRLDARRSWRCASGSAARRLDRDLTVDDDGNGNLFAWWGDRGRRRRGAHRQPLRLGAARRRLRRSARHRQRACSRSTGCASAVSRPARPIARGRLRRGGGRPVRRALPGLAAADRRDRPGRRRRR